MLAAKNVLSDERRGGQEANSVRMHVDWYRQSDCDLIRRQMARSNKSGVETSRSGTASCRSIGFLLDIV
jgi:hypothetical protein